MKTSGNKESYVTLTEKLTPEEYIKLTEVLGIDLEEAEIIPPAAGSSERGKIQVKGIFHRQLLKIFN